MRVFVSYRRGANGEPSALVRSVAAAIAAHGVDVLIDRQHVKDQRSFATALVDTGLNRSHALVAVVDAHWLAPRNLARLRASASVESGGDWVEFELRYALNHRMAIALVGDPAHLDQIDPLLLPGPMSRLVDTPCFATDDDSLPFTDAADLVAELRSMCRALPRLPSVTVAGDVHNAPTSIPAHAAIADVLAGSWLDSAAAVLEHWLHGALQALAALAAVVALGALLEAAVAVSLIAAGVSVATMLAAMALRYAWAWRVARAAERRAYSIAGGSVALPADKRVSGGNDC